MTRNEENYRNWLKKYKQTAAFKERNKEQQKKYCDKNREKLNEKRRRYYQENKEKEDATYYKKNKKKIQEYGKKYYATNYEKILKRQKEIRALKKLRSNEHE